VTAWAKVALSAVFLVNFLVAGCALPPKKITSQSDAASTWRGRLAVRVNDAQLQNFSAGFELTGNALAGEMTLFNPLGSTAAVLTWNPQMATMRVDGDVQHHLSLKALIGQVIGIEIPVDALFAWLAGEPVVADGWNPDLSQHANGRVTAKRTTPAPPVEIRLVLDHD
jgi:outer membrane lipoprotein LolB